MTPNTVNGRGTLATCWPIRDSRQSNRFISFHNNSPALLPRFHPPQKQGTGDSCSAVLCTFLYCSFAFAFLSRHRVFFLLNFRGCLIVGWRCVIRYGTEEA